MKVSLPVIVVLALALGAAAQDGGKVTFEFPEGGVECEVLLRRISAETGTVIVFDPQMPQIARKKIDTAGSVTLSRPEFFDWARGLLFTQRLLLVPIGPERARTFAAVDINSPVAVTHPVFVPSSELALWKGRDGALITTTIRLSHLRDTALARKAVAHMMTRQLGRVNDSPSSQSLVIVDFAPIVFTMATMLAGMDRDAAAADPLVRAAGDPLIRHYETQLTRCTNAIAARYFTDRIALVTPKK